MRNRKYRLWKVTIFIILIAVSSLMISLIASEMWEKIVMIVGGVLLLLSIPMVLSQYIEVQSDKIVTRGGNSLNKAYNRSFKKFVFDFNELTDIYVEANKLIWFCIKDGTTVSFPLGGFFNKGEIIGLVYEVRAQIKGYEQNKI